MTLNPCDCGEQANLKQFAAYGYAVVACPCGRQIGVSRGTAEEAVAQWNETHPQDPEA